jgi:hypothetical protein
MSLHGAYVPRTEYIDYFGPLTGKIGGGFGL